MHIRSSSFTHTTDLHTLAARCRHRGLAGPEVSTHATPSSFTTAIASIAAAAAAATPTTATPSRTPGPAAGPYGCLPGVGLSWQKGPSSGME